MLPDIPIESFGEFVKEPLPEAEWLIEPLFEKDSLVVLFGQSGAGKSFVALSIAYAISTGQKWLDTYPVTQGKALYAAAEGARGLRRRAAALKKYFHTEVEPPLAFYPAAPLLNKENEFDLFLAKVKSYQPDLLILDTLARTLLGDENTSENMGEWVKSADRIKYETGCCVLIIHHTPKHSKKGEPPMERGSGALRGAIDTSIGVAEGDGMIQLTNWKQKDEEKFPFIHVALQKIVLKEGNEEECIRPLTSMVVVPIEETLPVAVASTTNKQLALDVLTENQPLSMKEWTEKVSEIVSKATLYRWAKNWEEDEVIESTPEGYRLKLT